jgi:hypothetical protein
MFMTALCLVMLAQQPQVVTEGGPPPKPVPKDAPATLPATPQGRHVEAYIAAFNTGDKEKFLAAHETFMSADTLARRPEADRAKLFDRMRGDFDTLKVKRAVADGDEIRAVITDKDGNDAIFSFAFETTAPHRISRLRVDISGVQR